MAQSLVQQQAEMRDALQRYDAPFDKKFDVDQRVVPADDLYDQYNAYAEKKSLGPVIACPSPASIALAHLNLRTRGLVGIALGSSLPELAHTPATPQEIPTHRDFDVLILNPHSPKNPDPHEWGIDWWVRPKRTRPSNGHVQLWYDVALKKGVTVTTEEELPPRVMLNPRTGEQGLDTNGSDMRRLARDTRGIKSIEVPAGLYLPEAKTVGRIIRHCNRQMQNILYVLAEVETFVGNFDQQIRQQQDQIDQRGRRSYYTYFADLVCTAQTHLDAMDALLKAATMQPLSITAYGYTQGMGSDLWYLRSKLDDFLQDIFRDTKTNILRKRECFDYLSLRNTGHLEPLLPILPDRLLKFTGYNV